MSYLNSFVPFHSTSRIITTGQVQDFGGSTVTWTGFFHSTSTGSPSDGGSIDNNLILGFATVQDFYSFNDDAFGGVWDTYLYLNDNGGGTIDSSTIHSFSVGGHLYSGLTYTNMGGGIHQFAYFNGGTYWAGIGNPTAVLFN